jgi:hypothetical protein
MLAQDRCTVCTKCTIGSEIILDPPDGTCGVGQVDARISPFGDGVNLSVR